jgi:hypothetical protein
VETNETEKEGDAAAVGESSPVHRVGILSNEYKSPQSRGTRAKPQQREKRDIFERSCPFYSNAAASLAWRRASIALRANDSAREKNKNFAVCFIRSPLRDIRFDIRSTGASKRRDCCVGGA